MVSVDARGGRVVTEGWTKATDIDVAAIVAELLERGSEPPALHDVDRDGMLEGIAAEEVLARGARGRRPARAQLIYSGGIGSLEDLRLLAALAAPSLAGVIVGKALYEGRFTLAEGRAAVEGRWRRVTRRPARRRLSGRRGAQTVPWAACTSSASSRAWTWTAGAWSRASNSWTSGTPGDPVELAAHYDREGADELVFLDITATHERRETIVELARSTADDVFVPFTIGGGIRSLGDAQAVLDAGADKISVNSAALARPQLIDELARCSAPSASCSRSTPRHARGRPMRTAPRRARAGRAGGRPTWRAGARRPGATCSSGPARAAERGAGEILLTSMDRDGTNEGYDLELTEAVSAAVQVPVIASGGPASWTTSPRRCGPAPTRVLCASIFHYGAHTVAAGEGAPGGGGHCRPPCLTRLREQQGATARCRIGDRRAGRAHLVGGSVRDLLRGSPPRELDVVVEGEIDPCSRGSAARTIVHDRFDTASRAGRRRTHRRDPLARASATRSRARCRRSSRHRWPRTCCGATSRSTRSPSRCPPASCRAAAVRRGGPRAGDSCACCTSAASSTIPTRLWRLCRYAARLDFLPASARRSWRGRRWRRARWTRSRARHRRRAAPGARRGGRHGRDRRARSLGRAEGTGDPRGLR